MDVLTDFPERLTPGKEMAAGPRHIPVQIRSVRGHDQALLIAFQDYDTPEQASELRNQILYTSAADEPALGEGEYYHHEMLGMQVFDEEGNLLGVLGDILETGANDVYVVRPENGPEILLPAIDEVILEISLKKKAMRVHLLPGLVPPPD
jgi:16S rRNA processing protein RimM